MVLDLHHHRGLVPPGHLVNNMVMVPIRIRLVRLWEWESQYCQAVFWNFHSRDNSWRAASISDYNGQKECMSLVFKGSLSC